MDPLLVTGAVVAGAAATAVALLLLVLLLVVLPAAHGRPGAGRSSHGTVDRVLLGLLTRAIRAALRAGVRLGPMVMLTVLGRTTGLPRSTPVDLWQRGDDHYLVATHDENAAWVANLRAAGTCSARLGRRGWTFDAVELPRQEAGAVLRTVLAPAMRRPVAGLVLRRTIAVAPDAREADFVAAAGGHPVFRLTLTGGDPRPATAVVTTATGRRVEQLPVALVGFGLLVAAAHLAAGLSGALDPPSWVSGVGIGLLVAGAGNHLRIFGLPGARAATAHGAHRADGPERSAGSPDGPADPDAG